MAVGSLWAAYLAVLATLKLQFAQAWPRLPQSASVLACLREIVLIHLQTTAIALGIVEVIELPVVRVLAPILAQVLALKHPSSLLAHSHHPCLLPCRSLRYASPRRMASLKASLLEDGLWVAEGGSGS